MKSLSKHADHIVSDDKLINREIGFTETQINLCDSTCKIMETMNYFQF